MNVRYLVIIFILLFAMTYSLPIQTKEDEHTEDGLADGNVNGYFFQYTKLLLSISFPQII
jgi:hypothetical protein